MLDRSRLSVGRLSHPDECSSGPWNTESSHETLKLVGVARLIEITLNEHAGPEFRGSWGCC